MRYTRHKEIEKLTPNPTERSPSGATHINRKHLILGGGRGRHPTQELPVVLHRMFIPRENIPLGNKKNSVLNYSHGHGHLDTGSALESQG